LLDWPATLLPFCFAGLLFLSGGSKADPPVLKQIGRVEACSPSLGVWSTGECAKDLGGRDLDLADTAE
jgi:hypothetical protein